MQSITVEINSRTRDLRATIGERDVTEFACLIKLIRLRTYLPAPARLYWNVRRQRMYNVAYFLRVYNNDHDVLNLGLLAEAIKGYLNDHAAEALGEERTIISTQAGDAEIAERIAAAGDGHLLIGGRMFRLQSFTVSDAPQRMLARLRGTATEAIKRERERLTEAARQEAAIIRMQVVEERAALDQERAEWVRSRGTQTIVPQWLHNTGIEMKVRDAYLYVRQSLEFAPTEFSYPGWTVHEEGERTDRVVDLKWDALDAPRVHTKFWLPIGQDGRYIVESSYIDYRHLELPHARGDADAFCVQPGGMPERITSRAHLEQARAAIERAFRVVNLSSLLLNYARWPDEVKAFAPEPLRQWLANDMSEDPEDYASETQRREPPTMTWNVDDIPF